MTVDRRANTLSQTQFLLENYERRGEVYETVICDSPTLDRIFAHLRYKVLCEEHPEFCQDHNVDLTETDAYDNRSVKFLLIFKPLQMVVGGARIIMPDHNTDFHGLPCIEHEQSYFHTHLPFDINQSAEISRFILSRHRLKVARDYMKNYQPDFQDQLFPSPIEYLIWILFMIAKDKNLTTYCALLEKSLIRLLSKFGIKTEEWGDEIVCHGIRRTVVFDLTSVVDNMSKINIKSANFLFRHNTGQPGIMCSNIPLNLVEY